MRLVIDEQVRKITDSGIYRRFEVERWVNAFLIQRVIDRKKTCMRNEMF